jgi:putative endonuclease
MQHNQETGNKGEELAAGFLQQSGYTVLERNWRYKHWEVDIICSKANRLHFIEVKTRTGNRFGNPEESIGREKMNNLKNAAEQYQYLHPTWKYVQFDVVSVLLMYSQPPTFYLIEDVYF